MRVFSIGGRRPASAARLGALILLGTAGRAVAQGAPVPAPSAGACTAREVSREPFVVDGSREMYVEPTAVLPSSGQVFFAGAPNYLWSPGRAGEPREFVRDSVFGAIRGSDGRGRLVPAPIDPTRITAVRGTVLPDGRGWAFVFAELKNPPQPPARDTVIRFWYAVHDGMTWVLLDSLPAPASGQPTTWDASNLLVRGDTAFFSAQIIRAGNDYQIALYERRAGRWTVSTPPGLRGSYVRLFDDGTKVGMAVVHPDRAMAYDMNSLFLYAGPPDWGSPRKLVQGHPEPIHEPTFTSGPRGRIVTWWVRSGPRNVARALLPTNDGQGRVVTLDSSVYRVEPVAVRADAPIWVTEHIDPPAHSELRVVGLDSAGEPVILHRLDNPFTGPFGVAPTAPGEFLISGPLLRRTDANPSLVTLLIRVRVECASRAP